MGMTAKIGVYYQVYEKEIYMKTTTWAESFRQTISDLEMKKEKK